MGVAFVSVSRDGGDQGGDQGGGRVGRQASAKDKRKVVFWMEYSKSVYLCSSIYLSS